MAGEETPARPHAVSDAHECKQRAEELLGPGNTEGRASRAIAWALLAVAAELHIIRKTLRRG